MSIVRSLVVLSVAVVAFFGALRSALVTPPPEPLNAIGQWPADTSLMVDHAMAEVGEAAREGRPIPARVSNLLATVTSRDPLAPEPFLVEGARAQMNQRDREAEALFTAAKARDPRNGAARYFLADRYLRTGRLREGLNEISTFVRLVPGTEAQFVNALASFAVQPGSASELRRFFRRSPRFRLSVLQILAQDARNAEVVVALAGPPSAGDEDAPWQTTLINKLVENGQGQRAQALWGRLSGVTPVNGVFNPNFRQVSAPAPFNWTFHEGGGGLATPAKLGGLQLVYYGRDQSNLAQQVLALRPGAYSLSTIVSDGPSPDTIAWHLECVPGAAVLIRTRLTSEDVSFRVPSADCPAQRLSLVGSPDDSAEQVRMTIRSVRLVRSPSR